MLEEGAPGRGRRGSRTHASGGSSSNQSPQPESWRKKRTNERRRSRTLRRRQRAASGLLVLDSRKGLGLRSVILHRADAVVPKLHDGRDLGWPVGPADVAWLRDDNHGVLSAFCELHVALTPSCQALPGDRGRVAVHVTSLRSHFDDRRGTPGLGHPHAGVATRLSPGRTAAAGSLGRGAPARFARRTQREHLALAPTPRRQALSNGCALPGNARFGRR